MVWIYGGGFITGSGRMAEYGPEKWIDQGIIVVTVNYRCVATGIFYDDILDRLTQNYISL